MQHQKTKFLNTFFLILVLTVGCSFGQQATDKDPLSKYAGAKSPVKLFPGEISTSSLQWNNAFAQKNNLIFYCKRLLNREQLVFQKYDGEHFSEPEPIPFDSIYNYSDPYVNPKGDHLIFMSNLPYQVNQDSITTNFQLWQSHKHNNDWSKPKIVFPNPGGVGYPWRTKDGTLFFSMLPQDGSRSSNIYFASYNNGKYAKPIALPDNINSKNRFEGDAFASPNKEFLIFAAFDREGNMGFSDLYITFHKGDNVWSDPKSLGSKINSNGYDGSPYVTKDEKYLIFTSSRNSPGANSFFNHYIVKFNKEDYRD
ncbi:hypothetical protein [Allomuricauda sp. R78024]|uniref:hypothetical protein n=1 Tax=Allomuricauda sp. R78024 TaxID=3093867 RepID=UPI0037CCC170